MAVGSPDSSVTSLRVAGGRGAYAIVTRGCNGEILSADKVGFENAGVDLSHKFRAPVRVGARAGVLPISGLTTVRYVNPYLTLELPGFSISNGWFHSNRPPPRISDETVEDAPFNTFSGHIRTGKKGYWSVSYLEGLPVATGGYVQTGFGVNDGDFHIWGGTGLDPHDRPGLVANIDVRVVGGLSVGATGRLGSSGGVSESGFALALSYAWVHRREAPARAEATEFDAWPDSAASPRDSAATD